MTIASESFIDDYGDGSQYTNSKKRKRIDDLLSAQDQQHQLWADELLDYFMLQEPPLDPFHAPPDPPPGVDLDRPIDDKGHTALHWAAAMGDLNVVKDLINRGARIDTASTNGETPLMRAVIFTNNFDKKTMDRLAAWLIDTIPQVEWFGSTVFHHIAATTSSKSKYACARYYLDSILNKMAERYDPHTISNILNKQDRNGDTAITIAARNGARKCVRSLIGRNAAVDIPNDLGETADELIVQLNHRRRERGNRALSSSPFQMDLPASHSLHGPLLNSGNPLASSVLSFSGREGAHTIPQQALNHKSEAATALTQQIFPLLLSKSETLAKALDAEMGEKDAEVTEAERVVAIRKEEIEALKRQKMDLAVRDAQICEHDEGFDQRLEADVAALSQECEGWIEEEQVALLEEYVLRERQNGARMHHEAMDRDGEDAVSDKIAMLKRLQQLQQERIRLVKEVVDSQSAAGLGERHADYRRLITGALGVREEDVEGMLPDIVAELEELHGMEGVA